MQLRQDDNMEANNAANHAAANDEVASPSSPQPAVSASSLAHAVNRDSSTSAAALAGSPAEARKSATESATWRGLGQLLV